jgi:SAM-dependent methyltransferase
MQRNLQVTDSELLETSAPPLSTEVPSKGCIICGGKTSRVLGGLTDTRFGIPGSYAICQCSDCGLEQIDPLPRRDELKRFYEVYYNFGGEGRTVYSRLRDWFLSSALYRLWLAVDGDIAFHNQKGSGRLLDIGCNEGRGLKIYRRNGFQAEGLELNGKAAQVAREAGFTVYEEGLEDFEPQTSYQVVVLSNVLEHSLDPKRMLENVARILKPGGQVWISCPTARSWLRTVFRRSWINWHVPFHIAQFSTFTLRRMLADNGFTAIEINQVTPAAWVASSIIVGIAARPGRRTRELRNPLLFSVLVLAAKALCFPIFYIFNRLARGDCLVARGERSDSPNPPVRQHWSNKYGKAV